MEKMARLRHRQSTDQELERAEQRGKDMQGALYARSVRFSSARDSFTLRMFAGPTVEIPRSMIPHVKEASRSLAAGVTLSPMGSSLHWEALDMDFSVPGLIREVFGITEPLRRAGATKSPARAAASKANGRLGGRPRKKKRQKTAA